MNEVNKIKELYSKLINDKIIIEVVDLTSFFFDEPLIYHYYCVKNPDCDIYNTKAWDFSGSGTSFFRKEALLEGLVENIEKFSVFKLNRKVPYSTPKELKRHFLHPRVFRKHFVPAKILIREDLDNKLFGWESVINLTYKKEGYVPAQLIHPSYISYNTYEKNRREPLLLLPSQMTTGSAGGFDHESTLTRAIYEIIERDAVTNYYLSEFVPPVIAVDSISNKVLQHFIDLFYSYNFEIIFFDITTDLEIPTIMTMLIDLTGIGPTINLGFGTNLNYDNAIRKSIEDAFNSRIMSRSKMLNTETQIFITTYISKIGKINLNKKALLKRGTYELIQHLLDKLLMEKLLNKNIPVYSSEEELDLVIKMFQSKNFDIWYKDITYSPYKNLDLVVYKAIIPALQPPIYTKKERKYLNIHKTRLEQLKRYYNSIYEN